MGRDSTRVSHYAPRPIIHARDRVAAIARVGESKRAISTSSANRNAPWVSGDRAKDRAKKRSPRKSARATRFFARRVARARRRRATTREARGRDRRERAFRERARTDGRTRGRTADGGHADAGRQREGATRRRFRKGRDAAVRDGVRRERWIDDDVGAIDAVDEPAVGDRGGVDEPATGAARRGAAIAGARWRGRGNDARRARATVAERGQRVFVR